MKMQNINEKKIYRLISILLTIPVVFMGLTVLAILIYNATINVFYRIYLTFFAIFVPWFYFLVQSKDKENNNNLIQSTSATDQISILQSEANHYAMLHRLALFIVIVILIGLIEFVYIQIFGQNASDKFNIQKFIPLALPVSILIGVLISRQTIIIKLVLPTAIRQEYLI